MEYSLAVATLRARLETGQPVTDLDVRPLAERQECAIPGSFHCSAYAQLKAGDPTAMTPAKLPRGLPVMRVCATGRVSQRAAAQLRALPTPGHTPESVTYLLNERVAPTGDTLCTGAGGRSGLRASPTEIIARAHQLHGSLCRLLAWPADTLVLPGYTSRPVAFDHQPLVTSIGAVQHSLPFVRLPETEFVTTLLDRIPPPPPNYLAIAALNLRGETSDQPPLEPEAGANRCAASYPVPV